MDSNGNYRISLGATAVSLLAFPQLVGRDPSPIPILGRDPPIESGKKKEVLGPSWSCYLCLIRFSFVLLRFLFRRRNGRVFQLNIFL